MANLKISTAVITFLCCLCSVHGLFDWGSLVFGVTNTNQYLARFAVDQDAIFTAKARVKLKDPYRSQFQTSVKFLLMNDKEWDLALESNDCSTRASLARFTVTATLTSSGMWGKWEQTRINIKNRPQVWYILAADCDLQTHTQYPDMSRIEYEIQMFNDGSHFSHEYWGQLPISTLMLGVFSYLLFKTAAKLVERIRKEEELESPLTFLALAIYLEFSYLLLTFIHLVVFWSNGIGFWWMEYLATISEVLSQASIVSLILLIAFGWTITFENLKHNDNYIMIISLNLLTHFIIGMLTLVDNGEHHKYHDYEGVQGMLLVLIRLGLFGLFLWKLRETKQIAPKKSHDFLKGLTVSCSLYMCAFPLFYFVSYLLNPHMRLKFIMFGNLTIQMAAIVILVSQVTKKDTKYYKASKQSEGILPDKMN